MKAGVGAWVLGGCFVDISASVLCKKVLVAQPRPSKLVAAFGLADDLSTGGLPATVTEAILENHKTSGKA